MSIGIKNFKYFVFIGLVFSYCQTVNAGLNKFTSLVYVDDWLIERKVDLKSSEIDCRASLPGNATWFGARVRLGFNDELIKPIWIPLEEDEKFESKLAKIKILLEECRKDILFIPDAR